MNNFFRHLPDKQTVIKQAWQREVYQKPELAQFDSERIYQLLERRLVRYGKEPIPLNTPLPPENLPCLIPGLNKAKFGIFPLIPWLVSRQDLPLKIKMAIAGILLIIAGNLTHQDQKIRSTRNLAYQQVLNAQLQGDYLSLIQNAELFLKQRPLSRKDEREQQVIELYHEAFVRWFVEQEEELSEEENNRIKQYKTIIKYYQ